MRFLLVLLLLILVDTIKSFSQTSPIIYGFSGKRVSTVVEYSSFLSTHNNARRTSSTDSILNSVRKMYWQTSLKLDSMHFFTGTRILKKFQLSLYNSPKHFYFDSDKPNSFNGLLNIYIENFKGIMGSSFTQSIECDRVVNSTREGKLWLGNQTLDTAKFLSSIFFTYRMPPIHSENTGWCDTLITEKFKLVSCFKFGSLNKNKLKLFFTIKQTFENTTNEKPKHKSADDQYYTVDIFERSITSNGQILIDPNTFFIYSINAVIKKTFKSAINQNKKRTDQISSKIILYNSIN